MIKGKFLLRLLSLMIISSNFLVLAIEPEIAKTTEDIEQKKKKREWFADGSIENIVLHTTELIGGSFCLLSGVAILAILPFTKKLSTNEKWRYGTVAFGSFALGLEMFRSAIPNIKKDIDARLANKAQNILKTNQKQYDLVSLW